MLEVLLEGMRFSSSLNASRKETFKYELCLNVGDDDTIFNITGFYPSTDTVVPLPLPLPEIEDIEDQLNTVENKLVI